MKNVKNQLNEIKDLFNKAASEICRISKDENGFPEYPDSIKNLMLFLAKSDWMHIYYNRHNRKELIQNVNEINLEQAKALFIYICRSEKWTTGSWQKHLEAGVLPRLIQRAEILLKRSIFQKIFGTKIFVQNKT